MSTAAILAPMHAQEVKVETSGNGGIGENIVTAQRKAESMQQAGTAIDSVPGRDLNRHGIFSAIDRTPVVSALSISSNGSNVASLIGLAVGHYSAPHA